MKKNKQWTEIICEFYKSQKEHNDSELFFGDPVNELDLQNWEKQKNVKLSDELISLYATYNGFGVLNQNIQEWLLMPLDSLDVFIKEACDTFRKTHPELANRFYPFIDWGDGDVSGFLYTKSGSIMKKIYTFEHESYEHEPNQKWNEFLTAGEKNLEDVFSSDFSMVEEYLEKKKIADSYTPSSVGEWENWIRKYCESKLDGKQFQIAKGDQIDESDLFLLEKELNVTFLSDFHSFYRNFNGLGVKLESSETIWFIPSLANMKTFITEYRSRIDKSYKLISDYFIPIIDLDHDGLYGGYVIDQTGKIAKGLYMTDMDDYELRKSHNLPCEPTRCWENIAHMLR